MSILSLQTMAQPRWLLPTAVALALAACAGTPPRNMALEQVRSRLNAANADPLMRQHAAEELKRADAAVVAAEQSASNRDRSEQVSHLTHMAAQHLTLTQATADSRANQLITANAGAERDRMRLTQRTQEADDAQRQLLAASAKDFRQDAALATSDARADSLRQQLQAMNARPTPRGMVVTLGDLHFDSGASRLQGGGARHLGKLADYLKAHLGERASIEGHTDSQGNDERNQALSSARADSVKAALMSMGVAADQLDAQGFGETQPLADNSLASGRQQNRRVEVVLSTMGGGINGPQSRSR